MKKIISLLFIIYLTGIITAIADNLKFKSGSFKIMQLTDIHWNSDSLLNQLSLNYIEYMIQKENPDLIVFTGDIVTDLSPQKAWEKLTKPIIKYGIQWVATLGNHDSELNYARDSVYQILRDIPLNLNNQENLANFSLPVYNTNNKIGSVLYFFDSNAYSTLDVPGKYDWIKTEQIDLYRENSNLYTEQNNFLPIPSFAFLHIPLNEYKNITQSDNFIGNFNEDISSSELNSGLFAAMVQQKDVIGVFCGHDHNNDFIGKLHNIALAYGRCSGLQGYGDLRYGARIIEIKPNIFDFKSWISIPNQELFTFNYIANLSEKKSITPLPAKELKYEELISGLQYKYFEGYFNSTDDLTKVSPISNGITPNFSLEIASNRDHYGVIYQGFIDLKNTSDYTFYLASDDGAKLFIDNQLIVNNDGSHSYRISDNSILLEKGFHEIEVRYFEDYMGQSLEVGISSKYIPKMLIHEQWLYHK